MKKERLGLTTTTATQVWRQDACTTEQLREPSMRTIQVQRDGQRQRRRRRQRQQQQQQQQQQQRRCYQAAICRTGPPQPDGAEDGGCDGGRRLGAGAAEEQHGRAVRIQGSQQVCLPGVPTAVPHALAALCAVVMSVHISYTPTNSAARRTIVGEATSSRTPGHRRFPSTGFKAAHLAPSKLGSPLLSTPSSPMHRRPPTSQPGSTHDAIINALRVPVIHLLARQPASEAALAATCRASQANMRALLPKIAKRASPDADKWQLTDKSFRELDPFKFPYQAPEDREQAIENAIKAFDRQRLAKDDKLWQVLLPRDERGQGICLSRSKVKAPEPKPKASTPMHKISDLTKKKPVAKKADDKPTEKKPRVVKDPESKPKPAVKERPLVKDVKYEPKKAPTSTSTSTAAAPPTSRPAAPSDRYTPSSDPSKNRSKKVPAAEASSTPRGVKPKMAARDVHRDRPVRPVRPTMPINTKPKNPSPLSASPPVNASDFEDTHPVHKALAAAVSPAKAINGNGNSDRSLKRKANDIDSDIHNHNLAVKKPHTDRATPNHTPSHTNGRLNGSTPSSGNSLKRKSDDSSSSNTPSTTTSKARKVANLDTGLASRYHNNNSQASPGASSTSTTSPSVPSLSFRQTVELSQRFQKYYKKYEELYWQLADSEKAPTEMQRNDLLKMHKKLEEMKREIKSGAGAVHR
jgi:RNA polymerase II elongation factor ELL